MSVIVDPQNPPAKSAASANSADSADRLAVPAAVRPAVPLLAYQREDVESAARFDWCCWSRQIGKSFTKSLRRILRGIARRRNQVFLSAGERQSRELMLKAQQHCQALAIATEFHTGRPLDGMVFKHLEITLPGGVRIIGLPANPQTVRGFTGDVFLDEFAMHREDREIWAAVFPTVLRGDGELDVASTPKGPANLFAELRYNEAFRHSTVTLYDAIAQGLDLDAEEVRRSMHDEALFRQEFLCEFLDEVGAFLTYEQIAGCEDPTLAAPVRLEATNRLGDDVAKAIGRCDECFVGVDVGRRRDLTVMWILGARGSDERGHTRCAVSDTADPLAFHPPCPPLRRGGEEAASRATERPGGERDADTLTPSLPHEGRRKAVTLTPSLSLDGRGGLVTLGVIEMREAPFRLQYDVLRRVMGLSAVRRCCIDATGVGMAMAEAAAEEFGSLRVDAVTFTPLVKDRLATGLKRRVEDRSVFVPVDEAIRKDLHSVRWDVTTGGAGRFIVGRESDSHADRFWALALAIRAAEDAPPPAKVEFESLGALRFARAGIW